MARMPGRGVRKVSVQMLVVKSHGVFCDMAVGVDIAYSQ
jgi:hypothetical protein